MYWIVWKVQPVACSLELEYNRLMQTNCCLLVNQPSEWGLCSLFLHSFPIKKVLIFITVQKNGSAYLHFMHIARNHTNDQNFHLKVK